MSDLSFKKCVPCDGSTHPLIAKEITIYQESIPEWKVIKRLKIRRQFVLKNFKSAIEFVNKIAALAQAEGHHPDICLSDYKIVTIVLTTHSIRGLSVNDFILASKIDKLL